MASTILIVDDEQEIADLIEVYLNSENYTVFKYYCFKDALKCINEKVIDLAILDIMLPDGNGLILCQEIRKKYTFPIIMLTAKEEETDKITGLTLGADDYVTKPFKPLELIARVKAQLRRYKNYKSPETDSMEVFVYQGLVLDVGNYECTLDGKPLTLTPTEFAILKILCRQKGKVVSAESLFHGIWGDEYYNKNNNTIATHIRHLREKMGDGLEHPKYIQTVWGVGYKIEG